MLIISIQFSLILAMNYIGRYTSISFHKKLGLFLEHNKCESQF